jgi:transcriptional regulator of heat shock response
MDKNIVLQYIKEHPGVSSKQVADALADKASLATIKRAITELINSFYISVEGKARAT